LAIIYLNGRNLNEEMIANGLAVPYILWPHIPDMV
jgi:endonuclease YncB( thermonuclease family)